MKNIAEWILGFSGYLVIVSLSMVISWFLVSLLYGDLCLMF